MKTYQQLADYIKVYAITRGRTKGNAPLNRVVNSSQEYIRYGEDGKCIEGYMYGKRMFIMQPTGHLTVPSKPYPCPSEYAYMATALEFWYHSRFFKGRRHDVVATSMHRTMHQKVFRCTAPRYYLSTHNMQISPDGAVINPQEFFGRRVDRATTAQIREKLPAFANLFALWLTPDPSRRDLWSGISSVPIIEAINNEDNWEAICRWLANQGARKYISRRWQSAPRIDDRFYSPKAYIKEILMPILTVHEDYPTGVYYIDNNT